MRKLSLLLLSLATISFFTTSCSDDSGTINRYAEWEARNEKYLDSIVKIARLNTNNDWVIYKNYKKELEDDSNAGKVSKLSKYDSVYVKILSAGIGTVNPLFTDTVYTHYRGSLCNGDIFDQSYTGDLNLQIHKPASFLLSGLVTGWTTAFLHLTTGTRAELYIPHQMGYGAQSPSTKLPAYSVLTFNVYFTDIKHPKLK